MNLKKSDHVSIDLEALATATLAALPWKVPHRQRAEITPRVARLAGRTIRTLDAREQAALAQAMPDTAGLPRPVWCYAGAAALALLARRHLERRVTIATVLKQMTARLDTTGPEPLRRLVAGAIRHLTLRRHAAIRHPLRRQLESFFSRQEQAMAIEFYFDNRGFPTGFPGEQAYRDAVVKHLNTASGCDDYTAEDPVPAATVGLLLLREQFYSESPGFYDQVKKVYTDTLLARSAFHNAEPRPNKDLFTELAGILERDLGFQQIAYQQFAQAGLYLIERNADYPFGHPNTRFLINEGLKRSVTADRGFDTLELPPLVSGEGAGTDIEPDNIRAVAMIHAAYQLEQLQLFEVVDRILELFMNGLLPIGLGTAGSRLNDYYWDSEQRLNPAARFMVYGRVLGVRGADVSREVQPNLDFEPSLLRFISVLAEYDRQRRVADFFDSGRARRLGLSAEQVRKAGRDLASNASLYGYAGTHYAARRLNRHVDDALRILQEQAVLRAYGVNNAWQVVERVTTQSRQSVNIVRHHTMARSGKAILDLVAKYPTVWAGSDLREPLFDRVDERGAVVQSGSIPMADAETLFREAEYYLAVNGIKDQQITQYAQPEVSRGGPSLPSLGSPISGTTNGDGLNVDRLRDMVASGQTPSLDELRGMLNIGGAMV